MVVPTATASCFGTNRLPISSRKIPQNAQTRRVLARVFSLRFYRLGQKAVSGGERVVESLSIVINVNDPGSTGPLPLPPEPVTTIDALLHTFQDLNVGCLSL
jgi:hypothetical protein